ncbi:MAG: asparagine synthase (glutamine-hydrolyzing) [Dehalococcoidia bacterium]
MCGIAGVLSPSPAIAPDAAARMVHALEHRGPDEEGVAEDGPLRFGMARLAVLDIAGGHQPMWDEGRAHGLVFNGEIYNHAALRRELAALGHVFETDHSDTEVVLRGFREWGTGLFARLDGMFAIGVWDARARTLTLARDRYGEKPLYLARLPEGGWAFASELKSFAAARLFPWETDLESVRDYFTYGYIPAPWSILRGVSKVPAGTWVRLGADGATETGRYFDLAATLTEAHGARARALTVEDALDELDLLLGESVRDRMIADVPVGVFLSGGMDSASVAYYASLLNPATEAFTVAVAGDDESAQAALTARHLGMRLTRIAFDAPDAARVAASLADILDEPMSDSSILPTTRLCEEARPLVTVAVSGDGADEMLLGYRTFQGVLWRQQLDVLPSAVWPLVAAGARNSPVKFPGRRFLELVAGDPAEQSARSIGPLGERLGELLGPGEAAPAARGPHPIFPAAPGLPEGAALIDRSVYQYGTGYLQDDILVKMDRASMHHSLEVRSPFLGNALSAFALGLPLDLKVRGTTRKWLLRRLMTGRLPDEIVRGRKKGFGVPLGDWLRRDLRPLMLDLTAAVPDYLDRGFVQGLVREHLDGRDRSLELWAIMMLAAWHRRWITGPAA